MPQLTEVDAAESARATGWLTTPFHSSTVTGSLAHVLSELVDGLWQDAANSPAGETLKLTVRITSGQEAEDAD